MREIAITDHGKTWTRPVRENLEIVELLEHTFYKLRVFKTNSSLDWFSKNESHEMRVLCPTIFYFFYTILTNKY